VRFAEFGAADRQIVNPLANRKRHMIIRTASAVAVLATLAASLTGRARTPAPPAQGKIKQVILRFNDNPGTAGCTIVDSRGEVFDD
jgi:hypothetical protein